MSQKRSRAYRADAGFTYVGLLILVAIMGVTLAGIGTVWHTTQQRVREQQLLFVGNQFSQAINAYYQNSPGATKQYPKKLEDLLLDRRYPITARYLRKIFADPMTSSQNWGLIKSADGNIVGVYSLSDLEPVKKDNFGKGNGSFINKKHYYEWRFIYNANGNTMLVSNATPPPPANVVPPAYRVPPPDPLPADASEADVNLWQCQVMRSLDAATCATQAIKFGEATGLACMASANDRYTVCTTPGHGMLPTLFMKYK